MSENPLYYSDGQTPKPSNLKPSLSAALASLEVQLDEELARYRRTRISRRTPIQKSLGSLISATNEAENNTFNSPNQQSLTGEQAAAYIRQQQADNSHLQIKTPPPPPPIPETSPRVTQKQETDSQPNQIIPPQEEMVPPQNQTTSPQNQNRIVKVDINQNAQQNQDLSAPNNGTTKQPDDYLESSEALLRSLAEEQPSPQEQKQNQNTNHDSLLSPLSIGSMLLLLLASVTFGYIVFDLKNSPSSTFGGLFQRNQEVQPNKNTEDVSNIQAEPELTPIPKNPNLASDALPDINSIDDVAGATPKPKPTPTTAPPKQTATTVVEQMTPPVANTPATTIPEPEAAPTPQNLDEIQPSSGGFYNVIVDNTGDNLSKVKKIVPDAYLSPEGKYVYLGAFKSKDRVKKHLEFLQENGITARVEQPE